LDKISNNLSEQLALSVGGVQSGAAIIFDAFGENCRIDQHAITLGGIEQWGVVGIVLSLYALHAKPIACKEQPFKAFKEFPNTMPYIGAFATHTEQILISSADRIEKELEKIAMQFNGEKNTGGDFSLIVRPLPKVALCYIFYRADEDFPASVSCLYSNNAAEFLPPDALADLGEYTSKKILEIITV
jgi:hypothetical protein